MVFAQNLDRQVRRRLPRTIELSQPFFARCHVKFRFGRKCAGKDPPESIKLNG
jgi:hypothetical protein